jgi:hypothetical protein
MYSWEALGSGTRFAFANEAGGFSAVDVAHHPAAATAADGATSTRVAALTSPLPALAAQPGGWEGAPGGGGATAEGSLAGSGSTLHLHCSAVLSLTSFLKAT